SDARAQLGLPEDLFIIGTVARLEYSKNLELLIQTADKLRNHHLLFVILGDGPDRDHLSKIIERQQLTNHIMILNCFPDPKILIKAFNNFIITSRYEGLPYTLLEAGLSQTPIISPDVGGISEVIDQTYKADPDCLARQILALKKTPNSQTQITYQKIIANFSLAKMLAQTIQVYVETMA
ncbi:glycosyltransferase, partial [Patescibacteria group bacterium]|nr:glycosyltransferase [Patescibacteria group bacterium]MBU1705833.1 glycosyltransferase [Patescibacteria group bacterium]